MLLVVVGSWEWVPKEALILLRNEPTTFLGTLVAEFGRYCTLALPEWAGGTLVVLEDVSLCLTKFRVHSDSGSFWWH